MELQHKADFTELTPLGVLYRPLLINKDAIVFFQPNLDKIEMISISYDKDDQVMTITG